MTYSKMLFYSFRYSKHNFNEVRISPNEYIGYKLRGRPILAPIIDPQKERLANLIKDRYLGIPYQEK